MRTADALLTLVVGALGIFVGVQIVEHRTVTVTSPSPAAAVTDMAASMTHVVQASTDREPVSPANLSLPSLTPERLAAATGTYMADMLADLNGSLVRWPDRRETGLRIWVQSITQVRDWDLRYAQMARDAFADWDGNLPIRFDFVLDSATSDIQIVWTERFPPDAGRRVGTTNRTTDQNGWIVSSVISVAVHDSAGRTIPPEKLAGIVRHEAGHALGLGHSRDPATKMYPVEMQTGITAADRATLQLLYEVAPGRVQ